MAKMDLKMKEHIAIVIKTIRMSYGLTQAELAEELDVTPGHIGALEQGRATPSYELMEKIVIKYKIDANLFFGTTQQDASPTYELAKKTMENMLDAVSEHIREYDNSIRKLYIEESE